MDSTGAPAHGAIAADVVAIPTPRRAAVETVSRKKVA